MAVESARREDEATQASVFHKNYPQRTCVFIKSFADRQDSSPERTRKVVC